MSVVSVLVKRVTYDSACSEAGEKALRLLVLQKTSSLMIEFVDLVPHRRKTKQKLVIIVFFSYGIEKSAYETVSRKTEI